MGFLLTAGANWTGRNPLRGNALAALCLVWLAGYLVPGRPAFLLAGIADLVFFLWGAAALGRSVWLTRNKRNYGVPLLLAALASAHLLYLTAAVSGDYLGLMRYFNAGLLSMAVLTLLIARRVLPFFAKRAVAGLDIPPHTRSGHWQLAAGVAAIVLLLAGAPKGAALALAASALIALVQWLAGNPGPRGVPLLWILYAGYLGLSIGLLVGAAQLAGLVVRVAWPAHVIGVAGFGHDPGHGHAHRAGPSGPSAADRPQHGPELRAHHPGRAAAAGGAAAVERRDGLAARLGHGLGAGPGAVFVAFSR